MNQLHSIQITYFGVPRTAPLKPYQEAHERPLKAKNEFNISFLTSAGSVYDFEMVDASKVESTDIESSALMA